MNTKGLTRGGRFQRGSHKTYIPACEPILKYIKKIEGVHISPGYITKKKHTTSGRTIKIKITPGGFIITVKSPLYIQEIIGYVEDKRTRSKVIYDMFSAMLPHYNKAQMERAE